MCSKCTDTVYRQDVINTTNKMLFACDTKSLDDYRDLLVECFKVLPPAQLEQKWVPVTERMPDKEDWYIFSTDKLAWVAFWNGIEWSSVVAGAFLEDIIAWMPFPEPCNRRAKDDKIS